MIQGKQAHWWKWPLRIVYWAGGLLGAFILWAVWQGSGATQQNNWLIGGVIMFFALGYAYNTLEEKLNMILWKLEDLERRMGPGPDEDWQP